MLLMLSGVVKSQHNDDINSRDILYLTSGGKLQPLQANMDIRHYTISLDVDIAKRSISGFTEVSLNLAKRSDTLLLDLIHFPQQVSTKAIKKFGLNIMEFHPWPLGLHGMVVLRGKKIKMEMTGYPSTSKAKAEKCIFLARTIPAMSQTKEPI